MHYWVLYVRKSCLWKHENNLILIGYSTKKKVDISLVIKNV